MSRRKGAIAHQRRIQAQDEAARRSKKPDEDRRPRFTTAMQAVAEEAFNALLAKGAGDD